MSETYTGTTGSTQAYRFLNSQMIRLERSNSALRGWGTKYRKEIALLKKEQVDLRMAFDKIVSNPSGL